MMKMDGNALWSPECHRWPPPENAEAEAKALDLLRDALRQAEARELAALAELDEVKAKLREFSWNAKLLEFSWKPIETAPRDRIILLYRPGEPSSDRRVAPGSWDSQEYAKRPKPFWKCWFGYPHVEWDRYYQPTHWMPMPAPPTLERENG